MQVDYQTILSELGCRIIDGPVGTLQSCPLHPNDGTTLRIRQHEVTGQWSFSCTTPQCPVAGDIFSIVSQVRDITVEDTVALFKPGGDLHDALIDDMTAQEVDEYFDEHSQQVYLKNYLTRCHVALKKGSIGTNIRQSFTNGDARPIPISVGMLLTDKLPPQLQEFSKRKYKKEDYLIFSYSFDGHITRVHVCTPHTLGVTGETIPLVDNDIGLFMEETITDKSDTIYITSTAETAFRVRANHMRQTNNVPATVALAGTRLPPSCNVIKHAFIISLPDARLTLTDGLRIFAQELFVADTPLADQPALYVTDVKGSTSGAYGNISIYRNDAHRERPTLCTWLLRTMADYVRNGKDGDIYQALSEVALHASCTQELVAKARGLVSDQADTIIKILTSGGAAQSNRFTLANGRVILRTPDGFRGERRQGDPEVLSNVTFTVKQRIKMRTGKMVSLCTLQTGSEAAIEARIPDAAFSAVSRLESVVQDAFAARGIAAYVTFYVLPGYRWLDILSCISAGCPVVEEISQLGVDDNLHVNFPRVCLNLVTHALEPQGRAFTLPESAYMAYSGLDCHEQVDVRGSMRLLLEQTDNMYVAALALGIGHIIHQLRSSVACATNSQPFVPANLIYVETEPGIWRATNQQLLRLISNSDYLPYLPATNTQKALNELAVLGGLPALTCLDKVRPVTLANTITGSSVGFISQLNDRRSLAITEDEHTSFIVPTSGFQDDSQDISPALLRDIRMSLPAFFLEVLLRKDVGAVYKTYELPAWLGYRDACEVVEIEPNLAVRDLIQAYYNGIGLTGVGSFLNMMHVLTYAPKTRTIKPIFGSPADKGDMRRVPPVYIMDKHVIISKSVLTLVNREAKFNHFRKQTIDEGMARNKYLVEPPPDLKIDKDRYWVLDIRIWDKYVRKEPLIVRPVTSQSLHLKKIG